MVLETPQIVGSLCERFGVATDVAAAAEPEVAAVEEVCALSAADEALAPTSDARASVRCSQSSLLFFEKSERKGSL